MSDHVEFPGHDDQHASPPSEGDFPADFFDDAAEPPPVHDESASIEALENVDVPEAEPLVAHAPYPVAPPGPDEPVPTAPVFPIALGLMMIGVLVAAIFVSKLPPAAKPEPAAAAAATPNSAPTATAEATPAATDALSKELGGRIDALAAQLKAIEGKVDGLPKPAPAPDLGGIQGKIDALDKSVAGLAGLSEKVGKVDGRLAQLDDGMKSVREDIDKLNDELKKSAASGTPSAVKPLVAAATPETPAAATPKPDDSAAVAKGMDLFKAGKYKDAESAFNALAATDTKDARVFYYVAFSHALANNDWQGDTVTKAAAKGAELEKSGATKPADVDAAFASLPDNLKPWLAHFRKPKP
jgi:TolA-binding protein